MLKQGITLSLALLLAACGSKSDAPTTAGAPANVTAERLLNAALTEKSSSG